MNLSVIIPCFNAADTITFQLEALRKQNWSEPWEVIVSDNGSTDKSVVIVKQYRERMPNLRVVDSSERRGAAHARNVGVRFANANALAFVDADDEVAPGWLAAMGEALSKHDFVVGRKEKEKLNEPWVIKSYQGEESEGIIKSLYLPFAGSSNLGIKRSLHDAISGFDEAMQAAEDMDYCWRAQEAGTKLHYLPDALVHFRLRNTLTGMYHRAWREGMYEILVYKKHRHLGMPQILTWKTLVKASIKLPLQLVLLQVRNKESLGKWLRHFGWRGGNFQGCIKNRYLPL